MDQITRLKHVDFSKCKTCEYWNLAGSEFPCCDCLEISARECSTTPVFYKKKEK